MPPPETSTEGAGTTLAREGTYRLIIDSLRDNPAYLLLFGLGLLGGAMGIGATTVGFFRESTPLMVIGFSTWALLLGVSLLVIKTVELRGDQQGLSVLPYDQKALTAYLEGPDAEKLAGRWQVTWYTDEGEHRKEYSYYLDETVILTTHKSKIVCSCYDPTTKKTYWLDGRLADHGIVTLVSWSQPEPGIAALCGVLLLRVEDTFEAQNRRMAGWWRAHTRDGKITSGETDWEKLD